MLNTQVTIQDNVTPIIGVLYDVFAEQSSCFDYVW